jgi:1-acyl-sn-glycerol-3-phosphate acyltransferase
VADQTTWDDRPTRDSSSSEDGRSTRDSSPSEDGRRAREYSGSEDARPAREYSPSEDGRTRADGSLAEDGHRRLTGLPKIVAAATRLPDLSHVTPPPRRWMPAGRTVGRGMLRARFESHVHGLENLPRSGPVILASNHMGYLDGPLLFSVTPRPVHALVKREMFYGRTGRLLTRLGQIAVDRDYVDPGAVKVCLRVLADGGVVAIYPEGNRGLGDVAQTKPGAAYLALVSAAPVVPVACLGTRDDGAGMSSMPKRGARVDTVFGEPLRFTSTPVPWPRTQTRVGQVQAEIQRILAAHVREACDLTGQRFPSLPQTG